MRKAIRRALARLSPLTRGSRSQTAALMPVATLRRCSVPDPRLVHSRDPEPIDVDALPLVRPYVLLAAAYNGEVLA